MTDCEVLTIISEDLQAEVTAARIEAKELEECLTALMAKMQNLTAWVRQLEGTREGRGLKSESAVASTSRTVSATRRAQEE